MGQFALLYQPIIVASGNPYTHSYQLTIDHTQCGSSDSSSFPVLVSLTLTNLKTVANGGVVQNTVTFNGQTVAADLVFSLSSSYGSLLNWDFDSYDPVSGIINVWVQIPTVSHTTDTVFYMGVGRSSLTTYQGGAVGAAYDVNYQIIEHFSNGTTLSATDSTSLGNNGSLQNSPIAISGIIDGGASFTGSLSQYVTLPNLGITTQARTIEMWIYSNSGSSQVALVSWGTNSQSNNFSILINGGGAGNIYWYNTNNDCYTNNGIISTGTWYHIMCVYDGGIFDPSTCHIYLNGISQSLTHTGTSGSLNTLDANYEIANLSPAGAGPYYFTGYMDEVRISNTNRNVDWVITSYNNQSIGSTFISNILLY